MVGINAVTGKTMGGFAHVEQSIEKLLVTNIGERTMREFVGNPGTRLLGENTTERTILLWCSIVYALIEMFEPRYKIRRFLVPNILRDGSVEIGIEGDYRPYAHLSFVQAPLFISIGADGLAVRTAA